MLDLKKKAHHRFNRSQQDKKREGWGAARNRDRQNQTDRKDQGVHAKQSNRSSAPTLGTAFMPDPALLRCLSDGGSLCPGVSVGRRRRHHHHHP
jgi:hypothetical protein